MCSFVICYFHPILVLLLLSPPDLFQASALLSSLLIVLHFPKISLYINSSLKLSKHLYMLKCLQSKQSAMIIKLLNIKSLSLICSQSLFLLIGPSETTLCSTTHVPRDPIHHPLVAHDFQPIVIIACSCVPKDAASLESSRPLFHIIPSDRFMHVSKRHVPGDFLDG